MPVLHSGLREPLRAQRDPLAGDAGRPRSNREDRPQFRKQSWLSRFARTYGWRAYALPILIVVTVVVLYQSVTAPSAVPVAGEQTASDVDINAHATTIIGAPPKGLSEFDANLPAGKLPDCCGNYTQAGARTWRIVPGVEEQVGKGDTRVFTYTVEVEDGLDPVDIGGDDAFARMVSQTLANPKSWIYDDRIGFRRVDASFEGVPDFRVSLTSPLTIRDGCGYEIELEASCFNPAFQPDPAAEPEARVFLNEARWVRGAMPFQGDIGSYRQYLVNHEVGHAIGYQQHEACATDGALAPVMMQQTFSTSNDDAAKFDPGQIPADGKTCRFNPWPHPIA